MKHFSAFLSYTMSLPFAAKQKHLTVYYNPLYLFQYSHRMSDKGSPNGKHAIIFNDFKEYTLKNRGTLSVKSVSVSLCHTIYMYLTFAGKKTTKYHNSVLFSLPQNGRQRITKSSQQTPQ